MSSEQEALSLKFNFEENHNVLHKIQMPVKTKCMLCTVT